MDEPHTRIGVVSLGAAPPLVPQVIAAHISGCYNLDARLLPPLEHPVYAFDEQRLQYNAGVILKALEAIALEGYRKIVGVLDIDIFIPIFQYVYGEARQNGRCAIVSVHRLGRLTDGSVVPRDCLYARAAKVALHELGHLFNLPHCDAPACLMHFSGSLQDLDRLAFSLCRYCRTHLRDSVHGI